MKADNPLDLGSASAAFVLLKAERALTIFAARIEKPAMERESIRFLYASSAQGGDRFPVRDPVNFFP